MSKRVRPPRREQQGDHDNDISRAIQSLHNAEISAEGHRNASVDPYDNSRELPNIEQTNLDSLARLLTGNETCVAVCYVNNNILIASNRTNPSYAIEYLKSLQLYANAPFKQNYEALRNTAYTELIQVAQEIVKEPGTLENGKQNARLTTDTYYLELADQIINATKSRSIVWDNSWEKVLSISRGVIQDTHSTQQAKNLAIDIIRPIIDTNIITRAFETSEGVSREVIQAIRNGRIVQIDGSSYKHAEMKIVDTLVKRLQAGTLLKGTYYIGITKLCCCPCCISLDVINKLQVLEDYGINLKFYGTHGGTYPGWEGPNIIVQNSTNKELFLQALQAAPGLYTKTKEFAPYLLGNFIPDEPILSKFSNKEEAKSELIKLEGITSTKKSESEKLSKALAEKEEESKKLSDDIKKIDRELSKLNRNIDNLKQKHTQHQSNLSKLQEQNRKLEEFTKTIQNGSSLQDKKDAAREFLTKEEESIRRKVLEKLRNEKDKSKQIDVLIKTYKDELGITSELLGVEEQLQTINSKTSQFNEQKQDLQNQQIEYKETYEKNKAEVAETRKKVNDLTKELEHLTAQYEELEHVMKTQEVISAEQQDINNSIINYLNKIIYDNDLLNYPELFKEPLKAFSLSQILDLSTSLNQTLITEAIINNDSYLILGGLMSLSSDGSCD